MNKSSLVLFDKIISTAEEQKTLPWLNGFVAEGLPYNYSTGRHYNGQNVVMLWMGGAFNRSGWMTYKQAIALGGQVRKGEHGLPIIYARQNHFEEDEETGEKKLVLGTVKWYTVFNVSQIDGLKEISHEPANNLKAEVFLSRIPAVMVQGRFPRYDAVNDIINIPYPSDFEEENGYYSTTFHELIHWTANKVDRKVNEEGIGRMYEELVAELGSALLRGEFRVGKPPYIPDVEQYVTEWIQTLKANPDMLFKAMKDAEKAVGYLLEITKDEKDMQTIEQPLLIEA